MVEQDQAEGAAPSDKARHLGAWLRKRLAGEEGRRDWERLVTSTWEHLEGVPLRTLAPPDAVERVMLAQIEPDRLCDFVRPIVGTILPQVVAHLREDKAALGRWVPDSSRNAIQKMVSRPGLVHEELIRALFKQKAVEAVMADALYRGIRDFSTIMPRLMLGMMPTGRFAKLGGAGALGKRIVEEVEKRIEPEIKSFLKGGTTRALDRAADFAVEHSDDEAALAFRRNVVTFVLSKSPSFHTHALTTELLEELAPIVEKVTRYVATRDETKTLTRESIQEVASKYGDKPIGELLKEIGVEGKPDLQGWAELTWPVIEQGLEAPGVASWMDGMVEELLAEEARFEGA